MLLPILKVKLDLMKIEDTLHKFFNVRLEAKALGVPYVWAMERRKVYLTDTIKRIRDTMATLMAANLAGASELEKTLIKKCHEESTKIINRLEMQGQDYKTDSGPGMAPEMIQRAKDYDIKTLLPNPIRGNFTHCISHEDKHPSMGIKNNRVKCFVCGFGGDSIDIFQQLNNANFKEAVTFLNKN